MTCRECGGVVTPGGASELSGALKAFIILSFAIAHMGAFIQEEIRGPFCRDCRGRKALRFGLLSVCFAAGALVLGGLLVKVVFFR